MLELRALLTRRGVTRGSFAVTPEEAMIAWHDVENGAYDVDLDVWHALAAAHAGSEPCSTSARARGASRCTWRSWAIRSSRSTPRRCCCARSSTARRGSRSRPRSATRARWTCGRRFGLIIAPMQTVQLLDGPEGRAAFLRAAREHLLPGGVLASAIAYPLEGFDASEVDPRRRTSASPATVWLVSRPLAIRDEGHRVALVREREAVQADGTRTVEQDVIHLDRLPPATLEAEGAAAGLQRARPLLIPATDDYVASTVVMLRG